MHVGEAFDAQQVRGQSGTITAVLNALAKAGIELGENGSIFPRPTPASALDGVSLLLLLHAHVHLGIPHASGLLTIGPGFGL
jgi:hypothetical protein